MTKDDNQKREKHEVTHHIRAWRKHKGMSIAGLAEAADLTVSNISQIELGWSRYSQQSLEDMAKALGVTPADLLGRSPIEGAIEPDNEEFWQTVSEHDCVSILIKALRVLLDRRGPAGTPQKP